uniref:BTB domain-containing protein n=1 Tax=Caenorhabditis tropicalis TaxID=1561998 RepID=A0A1I7UKQ0_9PELO
MCERSKYASNGSHQFLNAREQIEAGHFPYVYLDPFSGIGGWYLRLVPYPDDPTLIIPVISSNSKPRLRYHVMFYSELSGSSFGKGLLERDDPIRGKPIRIADLKDELVIDYGLHIDAYYDSDGLWKFCLDAQVFEDPCRNYNHPQIRKIHDISLFRIDNEACAQIVHGVRIKLNLMDLPSCLKYAHECNKLTVKRYCERHLIEEGSLNVDPLYFALTFKTDKFLAEILKREKTSKNLMTHLKLVDVDGLTGEIMKQCVKFFLFR